MNRYKREILKVLRQTKREFLDSGTLDSPRQAFALAVAISRVAVMFRPEDEPPDDYLFFLKKRIKEATEKAVDYRKRNAPDKEISCDSDWNEWFTAEGELGAWETALGAYEIYLKRNRR